MTKATLRSLLAHKLRLALTGIAIVLGVGFVAGTLVLSDTLSATFDGLFRGINAGIDVTVRAPEGFSESGEDGPGRRAPLPAFSLLAEVGRVQGVEAVSGEVEGTAVLIGKDGKAIEPQGPPTLGVTFTPDDRFSTLKFQKGRGPANGSEFALDAYTARTNGFRVGDRVDIVLDGPARPFMLVGTFRVGTAESLLGATVSAFDLATAQDVFDRPGGFDNIDVRAADGVSETELRDRIRGELGGRYEVLTGTQLADMDANEIQEGIGFFSRALLVFGGVALLVGSFLIVNTFNIVVAQRGRELALLRAVGAQRRQVLMSVLTEAAITGAVCSAVGVAFGVLTAIGLRGLLDAAGFGLPPGALVVRPTALVVAFVVGMVITVAAGVLPARRATRVAPVEALRDVPATRPAGTATRAVVGSVLTALGAASLAVGLVGQGDAALTWVGAGALLVFFGVAALSPLLVLPVTRVIGAPAARFRRFPGRLARANAMRSPRRTAATAAALMVGLALVTLVTVLAASAQTAANDAVDRAFTADYIVTTQQFSPFPASLGDELARVPEVGTVAPFTFGQWRLDGETKQLVGVDPRALADLGGLELTAGELPAPGAGGLLVDEKAAEERRWRPGTEVPMEFARTGVQQVRVAGVYKENQLVGRYLLTRPDFERNFETTSVNVVVATKADGVPPGAARAAVDRVAANYPIVKVRDQTELKEEQRRQVNQLLGLVFALLLLSVLIALIGVVNTLVLSVHERTHELGLLRAVGMARRQVRSMIRWESVIISVFGTLLGMAVGLAFGWAVVAALDGIPRLVVPVGSLVGYVAVAALAGVLAAVWPARRAARLNVLDAISRE